jgi:hypothetical protein
MPVFAVAILSLVSLAGLSDVPLGRWWSSAPPQHDGDADRLDEVIRREQEQEGRVWADELKRRLDRRVGEPEVAPAPE